MENLKIELQKFDHERFNYHFSNLIDIGITSSRTDEMMDIFCLPKKNWKSCRMKPTATVARTKKKLSRYLKN